MTIWNSTLKRRKPLKAKSWLKSFTPLKRLKGMVKVSQKQALRRKQLAALKSYLLENRAMGRCELCGYEHGLEMAHIVNNQKLDKAANVLIICNKNCHRHDLYRKGLPVSQDNALDIARHRNELCDIDPDLTGKIVIKEKLI